jgi:SAM-dependent methyltransferase
MDLQKTTIRDDTAKRHIHKYNNKNFFHRFALGKYFDVVTSEINTLNPASILEFGCGEGLLLDRLAEHGANMANYTGVDIREDAIQFAKSRNPEAHFVCADIFNWPPADEKYDLVMACQVFEHLPDPRPYLTRLLRLSRGPVLLTVPHEPWFRLLNLARGRDLARLGNHPEHVNQWGLKSFVTFISAQAWVVHAHSCFPFIILLCGPQDVDIQPANLPRRAAITE